MFEAVVSLALTDSDRAHTAMIVSFPRLFDIIDEVKLTFDFSSKTFFFFF